MKKSSALGVLEGENQTEYAKKILPLQECRQHVRQIAEVRDAQRLDLFFQLLKLAQFCYNSSRQYFSYLTDSLSLEDSQIQKKSQRNK